MKIWKWIPLVIPILLVIIVLGTYVGDWESSTNGTGIDDFYNNDARFVSLPTALIVPDTNPYYALMATPLAIHYTTDNTQTVIPLLIQNTTTPSTAIDATLANIGITTPTIIHDTHTLTETSLALAETYWEHTTSALLIEPTQNSYTLAVNALPLASYLSMPVIITPALTNQVTTTLDALGVTHTLVIGDNLTGYKDTLTLTTTSDILNTTINTVTEKFGHIDYITLANPQDAQQAPILDSVNYEYEGTVTSSNFLLTQISGIVTGALRGIPFMGSHEFTIPNDYTYARIKIDVIYLDSERADETGETLWSLLYDPNGDLLAYLFGEGGIPIRDSEGALLEDRIHYETIVVENPGDYTLSVTGRFLTKKFGDYRVEVTVEKLENALTPLMPGMSSIAPYLTAYRKGIIVAKPEFAFTNDASIINNVASGSAYTASNPDLISYSNYHTFEIHKDLNELLARLADISIGAEAGIKQLREKYKEEPIHIALVGDTTMIPQYYYRDTEDAVSIYYGWDCPSDFIYGNIDAVPRDDTKSLYTNDTYSYYPYMENIVGRITGWDVQDASAVIARTVFYNRIINNLGDWKNSATVQSGTGTDVQRLPLIDLMRRLTGMDESELPTKWPTGAAQFENILISDIIKQGDFSVRSTTNLESMQDGFTAQALRKINAAGILNRVFFPRLWVTLLANSQRINGGENQENSNFIFSFAHGQPMGFNHGDVFIDSMGFALPGLPGIIHQLMSRWLPHGIAAFLPAGLSSRGAYNVRTVENMEMGPSVMMVESCFVGRIDGLYPRNCVSQAYVHAGVNTFIASSRGSPGPGYLDLRPDPIGLGIYEYVRTMRLYRQGEDPDLHLTPLQASLFYTGLINENVDVGTAFRNARNTYILMDANSTFYWSPPLTLSDDTDNDAGSKVLEKKYVNFYEYNIFGDPAFNPYEPLNNG